MFGTAIESTDEIRDGSESEEMVRFTFLRRGLAAAAVGTLAIGSAALIGIGPAAAAGVSGFAITPTPAATVLQGQSSQPAASVTFVLPNTFAAAQNVVLTVAPHGLTANDCTANNSVAFSALPKVTAVGNSGNGAGDTPPTITPTLSQNGTDTGCTAGVNDVLTLTLPAANVGFPTDTFTVTVSGIAYNVGSAAITGPVALGFTSTVPATTNGPAAPNANVLTKASAGATANNPAIQVTQGATGAISNIVVTETTAGSVSGTICITGTSTVPFTFSAAGSASASTGTGSGTISAASAIVASNQIQIGIAASTSAATTYTLTGVSVAAGTTTGPATVIVTTGGASCAADTASIATTLVVFDDAPTLNNPIAGNDTDATAIAELQTAYPTCPSSHKVILATDQNFPDALAASYLAGSLGTGVLLTPTANLSTETQKALQVEGITSVTVVGGPLAVSQNTINQVNATPAFNCGGTTATGSNMSVTSVIAGQTQYDTAEQIAATPGVSNVAKIDLAGAYTNAYNDTTGAESSSPSATGAIRTAIVASGANFPDATAASVIAYRNQYPLLLTDPNTLSSQATTGLQALGIQQVLVLGGPLAVSDADVTGIQALGISVIRIAGQDPTDTAQELASFELNNSGSFSGLGWGATAQWGRMILVARGDFYADALAGGVLGHLAGTPILLTENPSTVGQYLTAFLNAGGNTAGIDGLNSVPGYSGNIQTIQPLGGPLALHFNALAAMVTAVAVG